MYFFLCKKLEIKKNSINIEYKNLIIQYLSTVSYAKHLLVMPNTC